MGRCALHKKVNHMFTQDEKCFQWAENFIYNRYYKNLAWDKEVIPCIFDIGHNTGDFTKVVLNSTGRKVKIFAFEPNYRLISNFSNHPDVTLINSALSNTVGNSTLYVPTKRLEDNSYSTCSSLTERPVFKNLTDCHVEQISVEVTTVDTFCNSNNIAYIDYLKIDTEGYELEVIKGAEHMFSKKLIAGGQFEFGDTFKERNYEISDVINILTNHDYDCFLGDININNKLHVLTAYETLKKRSPDMWENIIFVDKNITQK